MRLRLKKIRTDKMIDDELEDDIVEEGVWVGKVLSERFKGSRVITDERIGKLSLIDESLNNKNLKWLVEQENKINLFLTLPVFLSLSFTGIMLFILFFLLKNKTISLRYSIVIIFLFFLTYFNVISYLQKNRIETENPVIQYKLVSLYQRVDYQVSAIT